MYFDISRVYEKENAEELKIGDKVFIADSIKELFRQVEEEYCGKVYEIKTLKEQIEKMKCCQNCNNWNWKHNRCVKKLKGDCFKWSKWEMKE